MSAAGARRRGPAPPALPRFAADSRIPASLAPPARAAALLARADADPGPLAVWAGAADLAVAKLLADAAPHDVAAAARCPLRNGAAVAAVAALPDAPARAFVAGRDHSGRPAVAWLDFAAPRPVELRPLHGAAAPVGEVAAADPAGPSLALLLVRDAALLADARARDPLAAVVAAAGLASVCWLDPDAAARRPDAATAALGCARGSGALLLFDLRRGAADPIPAHSGVGTGGVVLSVCGGLEAVVVGHRGGAWACPLGCEAPPRRLLSSSWAPVLHPVARVSQSRGGRGEREYLAAAFGGAVYFWSIAGTAEADKDEDEGAGVGSVDLGQDASMPFFAEGVETFAWSADGRALLVQSRLGRTRAICW